MIEIVTVLAKLLVIFGIVGFAFEGWAHWQERRNQLGDNWFEDNWRRTHRG